MNDELKTVIGELGDRFEEFKRENRAALTAETDYREELERKFNLARLGPTIGDSAGTPASRRALECAVKSLLGGDQATADRHFAEYKAAIGIADGGGGYVVMPELSSEMTRVQAEVGPFLRLPRIIELRSGDRFIEPVDRDQAGASWVGESTARPDTATPQLGAVEIPLNELYTMPSASQSLIDLANVNIIDWLGGKIGESFAATEVEAFVNGNGVSKPRGFTTHPTAATGDATRAWGTIEHVVTGANGAFVAAANGPADCIISLVGKLRVQYRQGAVFVMSRAVEALVRQLKDQQGRYLLTDSLVAGQPSTLLGYPVALCESMPAPATGSLSLAFGNFRKAYTIVRRAGVKLLVDPFTDKPNVRLYAYERVGGAVNNFEAVKVLKFST